MFNFGFNSALNAGLTDPGRFKAAVRTVGLPSAKLQLWQLPVTPLRVLTGSCVI
jgi:hypothetical protein